jgi:hypothetical protein
MSGLSGEERELPVPNERDVPSTLDWAKVMQAKVHRCFAGLALLNMT